MRAALLLIVLVGCETASDGYMYPNCKILCEWAANADHFVFGAQGTQIGVRPFPIDDLTITPSDQAAIDRVSDSMFEVHTGATGQFRLTGDVDGKQDSTSITVVVATVGAIEVGDAPVELVPRPTAFAVYRDSPRPQVLTHLVDDTGKIVDGHGLEHWAPAERLAEVTQPRGAVAVYDFGIAPEHPLVREVIVTPEPFTVSNGADSVTFREVALRSADHFAFTPWGTEDRVTDPLAVAGQVRMKVNAFTSANELLLGDAGPATATIDPALATVTVGADGFVQISEKQPGMATLTLTYDGKTQTFPIELL
jgi:hypothetical protein